MTLTVTDYVPVSEDSSEDCTVVNSNPSPILTLIAEQIGENRFDLWFGQNTKCTIYEDKVVFDVRNNFAGNSIRRHCKSEIDHAILTVCGTPLPFDFAVVKPIQKPEPQNRTVVPSIPVPIQHSAHSPLASLFKQQPDKSPPSSRFVRKFASLSTFLEGLSNRLACRTASLAIEHPGKFNPIYFFGPTSVGKTHLLEGIWSAVRTASVHRTPLYMTAEQFMTAFINNLRSGSLPDRNNNFRSRFSGISHLLIDDIHFFARGDSTQTELLQVFDMLQNQGVQLVFSGDRPLKDLPLRNELLCRLEHGVVVGIELPERELALRICENLIKQRNLPIEADVARLIASRFGVHARQISGALNRLHAEYLASGKPITLSVAEDSLSDLLRLTRRDVRLQDIGKAVCETFGLSEESLRSKSRVKQIAAPRMLAMWLARKYTRYALSEIGLYFGNHSHSSVISAQRKIDRNIGEDQTIAEAVQKIEQMLQ